LVRYHKARLNKPKNLIQKTTGGFTMTLYVRSPFAAMRRRMFESMFDPEWSDFRTESAALVPVDVEAENETYVISALLPGVKAEDLNIQVVNETVTISGEFKHGRNEEGNYLLAERPAGRFTRTITLPVALNAAKAEADLTNGVLTLRVPKAEEAMPKSIKVVSK
jgi:HSP20 family protein